jgi:hypothetical protein
VNQLDAAKISLGQELLLKSPDSDEATATAKIQFIAPLATVKNNIKGFEIRGLIDKNEAGLKPGVSVSVRLGLAKASDVVAVPVTAVFENGGNKVAYVLEESGPVMREVVVGAIDTDQAEIQSGISEGKRCCLSSLPRTRTQPIKKPSREPHPPRRPPQNLPRGRSGNPGP